MLRLQYCAIALSLLTLSACGGGSEGGGTTRPVEPPVIQPPVLGVAYTPSGRGAAGDVFVHLFEWKWTDIARECEVFLGPRGFKGVQISPPSEHAIVRNSSAFFPWWQRYQPVSYKLDASRSGTEAELRDMVSRCKAVGVDIYADAVINHMTAGAGTGSAGTVYTKYSYPSVPYTQADFNSPCSIDSYQNAGQVQNCELVGLSDLATARDTVRGRIARYLITLHELGIAGFRIDAAKHMPPNDLEAIMTRVNNAATAAGRPKPYVFLEIINNSGEAVIPQQYYGVGFASGGATDITDFQYGYRISDGVLGRNSSTLSTVMLGLAGLDLLPSDKSVVFVDNHDNQRGDNLYYADSSYDIGVMLMLAHPVGYPGLMSSFGFVRSSGNARDAGPASDANGNTISVFEPNGTSRCSGQIGSAQVGQWICEHRRLGISNMVAFRKAAAAAPLSQCGRSTYLVGTDPNRIAFCRDGAGFFAASTSTLAGPEPLQTRLPAGSYCNVAQFAYVAANGGTPATCSGTPIVVAADGSATIPFARRTAVALHLRARMN
jgi:alpha-amylase